MSVRSAAFEMTPSGAEGILIRRLQADDTAALRALRLEAIEGEPTAFSFSGST